MTTDPGELILLVPVLLWALSFHEMSHAWVALRLGDPTARDLGRVTLNPLRHLDPIGTLMVFVAGFGWARPVPVDPRNLASPRRDGLWIAAAGPGANLLSALAAGLLVQALARTGAPGLLGAAAEPVFLFLVLGVNLNLALAVFNLIPLHPLDGAAVLKGLVSAETAARLERLDAIGPLVLLLLIVGGRVTGTSFIGLLLGPVVGTLRGLVTGGLL